MKKLNYIILGIIMQMCFIFWIGLSYFLIYMFFINHKLSEDILFLICFLVSIIPSFTTFYLLITFLFTKQSK